jgi:hypothetical protein
MQTIVLIFMIYSRWFEITPAIEQNQDESPLNRA